MFPWIKSVLKYCPLLVLSIVSVSFHYSNIYPHRRGFFCHDHSLKYPYVENQTIPKYLCLLVWLVLVSLVLATSKLVKKIPLEQPLKHFLTGLIICLILTDVLKHIIGRLRPHFLTLCNPDFPTICYDETAFYTIGESNEQHFDDFSQKYVNDNETIICNNTNSEQIREARLSFISGHASFSFYCASFLIIFMLKYRKTLAIQKDVLVVLYLLISTLASLISITRISDYLHHPMDVVIGALMGTGISCLFNIISTQDETSLSFKKCHKKQREEIVNDKCHKEEKERIENGLSLEMNQTDLFD